MQDGAPLGRWNSDECPFTIEYSRRVLEDIRLAVVDAFYSLPRGGAEIGGLLLGSHTQQSVTVTGFLPLECEHALGPSFNLSVKDHSRMVELIAAARAQRRQVVGWY